MSGGFVPTDLDVAHEIVARMDGHRDRHAQEFVVPGAVDRNGSFTEFTMTVERRGEVHRFNVQVRMTS